MSELEQIEVSALGQVRGLCPLIQVFDMNEAVAFYRDRLGFELVSDSGERDTPEGRLFHWCWLRLGGADLMLNTAYDEGERPGARDPAWHRAHGDTCLYFAAPDVDGVAVELASKGVAFEGPRDAPYGMRQLWFSDPDGYQLCFQAPV
jgi:catechol 2,3-dioxygenase-like lactoylglutathione lyase family enzyme